MLKLILIFIAGIFAGVIFTIVWFTHQLVKAGEYDGTDYRGG